MFFYFYVSQLNILLDDDIILMFMIDLESYIIYVNDIFVQVSGYQLNELLVQLYNLVCYLDMLKVVFVDMWYILKQGELWSGIVKNWCKNGDYYWVRVNVVLMICEGCVMGYMLICIWVMDDEIVVVEFLYQVLNEGWCSKCIYKGLVVCQGLLGKLFVMFVCW